MKLFVRSRAMRPRRLLLPLVPPRQVRPRQALTLLICAMILHRPAPRRVWRPLSPLLNRRRNGKRTHQILACSCPRRMACLPERHTKARLPTSSARSFWTRNNCWPAVVFLRMRSTVLMDRRWNFRCALINRELVLRPPGDSTWKRSTRLNYCPVLRCRCSCPGEDGGGRRLENRLCEESGSGRHKDHIARRGAWHSRDSLRHGRGSTPRFG